MPSQAKMSCRASGRQEMPFLRPSIFPASSPYVPTCTNSRADLSRMQAVAMHQMQQRNCPIVLRPLQFLAEPTLRFSDDSLAVAVTTKSCGRGQLLKPGDCTQNPAHYCFGSRGQWPVFSSSPVSTLHRLSTGSGVVARRAVDLPAAKSALPRFFSTSAIDTVISAWHSCSSPAASDSHRRRKAPLGQSRLPISFLKPWKASFTFPADNHVGNRRLRSKRSATGKDNCEQQRFSSHTRTVQKYS